MPGFLTWVFKVSKLALVKVTVIKIGDDGNRRILESQFCLCDHPMGYRKLVEETGESSCLCYEESQEKDFSYKELL
ncbi:hypothetical protein N7523_005606 [Penicillium sp. IBT 18751x]|nr:hypothetical protein N7523_005802 [Penicillium sp. IBT 18751x]KAJ6117855.1 hypothetical protein N7523_005606 [Penicillium sp. IBT 18751x]